MRFIVTFLLGAMASTTLFAEENLMRDYSLEDFRNSWITREKGITRNSIEAFEGLADTFYFLSGKGRTTLLQNNVRVKPDTWYKLEAVYRNIDGVADEKTGYHFFMTVKKPDAGVWNGIAAITSGDAAQWTRRRLYFNSGNNDVLDVVLMFFGPSSWDVGRITLTAIENVQGQTAILSDGDFEMNTPGQYPVDFRKTGSGTVIPAIRKDASAKSGKQVLCSKISGEGKLLVTPILLKNDDRFKISFFAKSNKAMEIELTVSASPQVKLRLSTRRKLDSSWQLIELEGEAPLNTKGFYLLNQTISFWNKGENEVFIDHYSASVEQKKKGGGPVGKNYIRYNSSFEAGSDGWYWLFFEDPNRHGEGGRVTVDNSTAGIGNCSLKIVKPDQAAEAGIIRAFNLYSPMIDLPLHKTYTLSFMARADKQTTVSAGLIYNSFGKFNVTSEWKRFSAKTVNTKNYRTDSSNRLQISSPLDGSTLYLDAVQLEAGDAPSAFVPDAEVETGTFFPEDIYKIYLTDTAIRARTQIVSHGQKPRDVVYHREIRDYLGNIVSAEKSKLQLEPEKTVFQDFSLPSSRNGWFSVHSKISAPDGKELASAVTSYSVMPPPRKIAPENSWFGILGNMIGCGRRGDQNIYQQLPGGTYSEFLKICRDMGFTWFRLMPPGNWNNIEKNKGQADFAKWDNVVNRVRQQGFNVHVDLLSYRDYPAWSNSGKPLHGDANVKYAAKPEDAARFAANFAGHFKNRVNAFTLLSETGGYDADEYYELIKAIYPAVKKNAPDMIVMGPGYPANNLPFPDGVDDTFITSLLRKGLVRYIDVLDIHPYLKGHAHTMNQIAREAPEVHISGRWGTRPELLEAQIRKFHTDYGKQPIWDTESGILFNSTAPWMECALEQKYDWYTPEVALGRMVRWGIIRMGMGIKRHFYFLFFQNLPYAGLNLVNNDMTPRPGIPAHAAFARFLDGSRFYRKVVLGADTWVFIFQNGKETVATYWNFNLENKGSATLVLPKDRGTSSLYDVMGNDISPKNDSFLLASTPCYFISDRSPAEVAEIFSKAKILGTLQYEVRSGFGNLPSGKPAVFFGLRNLRDETLPPQQFQVKTSGAFLGDSTLHSGTVAPLKIQTVGSPVLPARGNTMTISVTGKTSISDTKPVAVFPALRKDIAVDGIISPGEYASPVLSLEHPKYSARLLSGWTPDALYLAVTVKDCDLRPAPADKPIFTGDSVEFYFDFSPEKSIFATKYHSSAIRVTVAPTSPARVIFDRDGIQQKIDDFHCFGINEVKCAFSKTSDGYVIEIKFPMKEKLYEGKLIGFNLQCVSAGEPDKKNNVALNWCGKRCWDNIRNLGIAITGSDAGH